MLFGENLDGRHYQRKRQSLGAQVLLQMRETIDSWHGAQVATRWERMMWRVRMDGRMDGFTFDSGDAAEELGDALDTDIEVHIASVTKSEPYELNPELQTLMRSKSLAVH